MMKDNNKGNNKATTKANRKVNTNIGARGRPSTTYKPTTMAMMVQEIRMAKNLSSWEGPTYRDHFKNK